MLFGEVQHSVRYDNSGNMTIFGLMNCLMVHIWELSVEVIFYGGSMVNVYLIDVVISYSYCN